MFEPAIQRHYSDIPLPVFTHIPEMKPYLAEPKAAYLGVPGKMGYLNMEFERDPDGRSVMRNLDRRAPLIVQQELYFDEEMPQLPCVYILSSGGPMVDGDRFRQNITVRKGAEAFISTGAATKVAVMQYNFSGMEQNITVEQDGYLEFMPEPTYPCAHARFHCRTRATVHPTATMLYSEVYMSGRKHHGGERFLYDILSVSNTGLRPDGTELFCEKFVAEPARHPVQIVGVMGSFDVFANVVVMTPPEKAEEIFAATTPTVDRATPLLTGITRLPSGAGVLFKVLGSEPGPVKKAVRQFCSGVRMAIKGKPLPAEFPWR